MRGRSYASDVKYFWAHRARTPNPALSMRVASHAVTAVARVATVAAFVAAAALLTALLTVAGCKRRTSDAGRGHVPLAAGGAPADDGDAGDALVEDARRYDVRTWTFALDRYEMRIEDVGMSTALDDVLKRANAELVVNGGFFDPQGKPVGLVMSDGAVLSRLATSLSGGVVTSDGERAKLWESESFKMPEGAKFALQCRPRLVVDGIANVKRDDGQRSERTALCLRDGGKTIDVVIVTSTSSESAGPSLFALGRFLARRGCEGALNLDGGPSTGIAWREEGAVRLLAPHRPVKHGVSFRARGATP
jgi:uncharacterized protein YigE (DUF2233 family)